MRVPVSWLSDFVEVPDDLDALAADLSAQGLKVESVERPVTDLQGVVVSEVRAIDKHPNADRLILVEVDAGGERRRVVCGAHNFEVGDLVPLSPPGARLPQVGTIERRKVRGETSDGMLCSAKELGVSDDHSGILVLPPGSPLGADVKEVLGLGEAVLVFDITPNRPDAMSLIGVAREVAALTGGEMTTPSPAFDELGDVTSSSSRVVVEDVTGCPRYLARLVRGVQVGPSDTSVQIRLAAAGFRPVSNVVDATNYALWVTGHPLHAFDLARLEDATIVVRRARPSEKLTTLDGVERTLDEEDLVIADSLKPVGIAGIMGGEESEVSPETTDILLESAYFDPRSILRSSKRHGLRSEASARFERGADPNNVGYAADLACSLMAEWASGSVAPEAIDLYDTPIEPRVVSISVGRVNRLLGTDLDAGEAASALKRIEFGVEERDGTLEVTVPTRRPDVTIEEDLVEEVARLVGYERIPTTLPSGAGRRGALTAQQGLEREARRILTGAGVTEAYTSSFISPRVHSRMGYPAGHEAAEPLRIANPLSEDQSLLRPSLVPGLLHSASHNVARRRLELRLFEIGHCFLPSDGFLPREPFRLGVLMHGPIPKRWHSGRRDLDFYDLKGVVELLLDSLWLPSATFEAARESAFHPGRTARVEIEGRTVGILGEISSDVAGAYELTSRTYLAELDLEVLLEMSGGPGRPSRPPMYPAVLLDLAVAVPLATPAAAVVEAAWSAGGEILESVELFDVYTGEQVGEGRKSLALSFTFRREDRTLEDAEAIEARDRIGRAMVEKFGGEVRGS